MTQTFIGVAYVPTFEADRIERANAVTLAAWLATVDAALTGGDYGKVDDSTLYATYARACYLTDAEWSAARTRALADALIVRVVDTFNPAGYVLVEASHATEYERFRTDVKPAYDQFVSTNLVIEGSDGLSALPADAHDLAVGLGVSDADFALIVQVATAREAIGIRISRNVGPYYGQPIYLTILECAAYDAGTILLAHAYTVAAWLHDTFGANGAPYVSGRYAEYGAALHWTGAEWHAAVDKGFSGMAPNPAIIATPPGYVGGGAPNNAIGLIDTTGAATTDAADHTYRLTLVTAMNALIALVVATGATGLAADPALWHSYAVTLGVSDADFAIQGDMAESTGLVVVKTT